jgi:hypothetical protein
MLVTVCDFESSFFHVAVIAADKVIEFVMNAKPLIFHY